MKISFLVPFRDDDNGWRTQVWEWMRARWEHYFPKAEIVMGTDDGVPFSKTSAVNDAARRATGDMFVLLDADSWLHAGKLSHVVERIERGESAWVIPAARVYRLTQPATEKLLSQSPSIPMPTPTSEDTFERKRVVGFLHVFPRAAFEAVGGMDPRFAGWGWEDLAWRMMLDTMWGKHTRLGFNIVHLWHPIPSANGKRVWHGQTDRNVSLGQRYKNAHRDRESMAKIVEEVRSLNGRW